MAAGGSRRLSAPVEGSRSVGSRGAIACVRRFDNVLITRRDAGLCVVVRSSSEVMETKETAETAEVLTLKRRAGPSLATKGCSRALRAGSKWHGLLPLLGVTPRRVAKACRRRLAGLRVFLAGCSLCMGVRCAAARERALVEADRWWIAMPHAV
jgi:hypothetical protein